MLEIVAKRASLRPSESTAILRQSNNDNHSDVSHYHQNHQHSVMNEQMIDFDDCRNDVKNYLLPSGMMMTSVLIVLFACVLMFSYIQAN